MDIIKTNNEVNNILNDISSNLDPKDYVEILNLVQANENSLALELIIATLLCDKIKIEKYTYNNMKELILSMQSNSEIKRLEKEYNLTIKELIK